MVPEAVSVAATVRDHDVEARSGSLLLDDGSPLAYDAAAFDAGGLRLLRSGQRVQVSLLDGVPVAVSLPS